MKLLQALLDTRLEPALRVGVLLQDPVEIVGRQREQHAITNTQDVGGTRLVSQQRNLAKIPFLIKTCARQRRQGAPAPSPA